MTSFLDNKRGLLITVGVVSMLVFSAVFFAPTFANAGTAGFVSLVAVSALLVAWLSFQVVRMFFGLSGDEDDEYDVVAQGTREMCCAALWIASLLCSLFAFSSASDIPVDAQNVCEAVFAFVFLAATSLLAACCGTDSGHRDFGYSGAWPLALAGPLTACTLLLVIPTPGTSLLIALTMTVVAIISSSCLGLGFSKWLLLGVILPLCILVIPIAADAAIADVSDTGLLTETARENEADADGTWSRCTDLQAGLSDECSQEARDAWANAGRVDIITRLSPDAEWQWVATCPDRGQSNRIRLLTDKEKTIGEIGLQIWGEGAVEDDPSIIISGKDVEVRDIRYKTLMRQDFQGEGENLLLDVTCLDPGAPSPFRFDVFVQGTARYSLPEGEKGDGQVVLCCGTESDESQWAFLGKDSYQMGAEANADGVIEQRIFSHFMFPPRNMQVVKFYAYTRTVCGEIVPVDIADIEFA